MCAHGAGASVLAAIRAGGLLRGTENGYINNRGCVGIHACVLLEKVAQPFPRAQAINLKPDSICAPALGEKCPFFNRIRGFTLHIECMSLKKMNSAGFPFLASSSLRCIGFISLRMSSAGGTMPSTSVLAVPRPAPRSTDSCKVSAWRCPDRPCQVPTTKVPAVKIRPIPETLTSWRSVIPKTLARRCVSTVCDAAVVGSPVPGVGVGAVDGTGVAAESPLMFSRCR